MRGLAIVIMIQCHTFNSFARIDLRESGPYLLSQFVGGMAAPLFLFMSGMTLAFQMDSLDRREPNRGRRWLGSLRRAGYILAVAFTFRLSTWVFSLPHADVREITKVDILNSMGLGLMVLSVGAVFDAKGRARFAAAAGMAIAAAAPLVSALDWNRAPTLIGEYLAPSSDPSSATPLISFYEPRPHETLEYSLQQARSLWEQFSDQALWVDELRTEFTFSVRIEGDWSVQYTRTGGMSVRGPKPPLITRSYQLGISSKDGPASFLDIPCFFQETTSGEVKDLVRIPAINEKERKGFVLFYTPPISAQDANPRVFTTHFTIPQEFADTLGKGHDDEATYSVRQLAKNHTLKLRFRVLISTSLPEIGCVPDFGKCATCVQGEIYDGTAYRVFECETGERPVTGTVSFGMKLYRIPTFIWP